MASTAGFVGVQLLIDNGVEPKAPDAPLPAPVSLFKLPSEANVRQASQLPPQGLLKGPVRRSTVEKQRIYDVRAPPGLCRPMLHCSGLLQHRAIQRSLSNEGLV